MKSILNTIWSFISNPLHVDTNGEQRLLEMCNRINQNTVCDYQPRLLAKSKRANQFELVKK